MGGICSKSWTAHVKNERDGEGNNYVVVKDYALKTSGGKSFVVRRGFRCDGCTGAPDFLDPTGWLLHDWLYTTHGELDGDGAAITRAEADAVLEPLLRDVLTSPLVDKLAAEAWKESYMNRARLRDTEWGKQHQLQLKN